MANALMNMPSTGSTIASYLTGDAVKKNIGNVIGEANITRFASSIVSAVQANPQLAECTNQSILSAALQGESLQLAPSPQLGYFYMVPYKTDKNIGGQKVEMKEATFQIGWRGMIQLAIRSGQYKKIVVNEIKEGEIEYNPITEDIVMHPIMDPAERTKANTVGYYAMFELNTGFKKEIFTPIEVIKKHAETYSRTYRSDLRYNKSSSVWSTNFDAMAKKTMIRQLLGRWGIMSVEMQQAYVNDMSVIDENGRPVYVDNPGGFENKVREDIAMNANSEDFDDDVIEVAVTEKPEKQPAKEETPKQKKEEPEQPKQKRGRATKKQEPADTEVMPELELTGFDGGPEWGLGE